MNRIPRINVFRVFRRTAVPLASYYAVTLALVVLIVPPVVIVFACAVHTIVRGIWGTVWVRSVRL
jgi:hypothetical protein